MDNNTITTTELTIGLDIGDKRSLAVVLDKAGEWLTEMRVATDREAMASAFRSYRGARVVLEVGTHSPWISRILEDMGLEVIVANPRRVRLIAESYKKTDRVDAEMLARLGRADPRLLAPVVHRDAQAQQDLCVIRLRDGLIRSRAKLVLMSRGICKSLGLRIPACSTPAFPKRVRVALSDYEIRGLEPVLASIEALTAQINTIDREIEDIANTRYPEHRCLTQVTGVGTLTAMTFILVIGDPARFEHSRDVAAFLGLVPKRRESGESQPALSITKCGDPYLRSLLVSSAHYILGHFGPDTELRRFGERIINRGGPAARKRAAVAVARKLSVLLYSLWTTGEVYAPVGYTPDGAHLLNEQLQAAA